MFKVSRYRQTVSVESASQGEYEDITEEYSYTGYKLRDVLKEIKDLGCYELSAQGDDHFMIYGTDAEQDYTTGDEITYALAIEGSPKAIKRVFNILNKQEVLK